MPCKPLHCVYGRAVIPQRIILSIMLFLAMAHCYIHRVCLNLAITEMTIEPEKKGPKEEYCHYNDTPKITKPSSTGKYRWTEEEQAYVLGTFYLGYAIGHMPGGIVADKFGGRHTVSFAIFAGSVLTLVTPVIVKYGGKWCLIALRFFLGLVQGPMFPATATLLAHWVPEQERSRLGSLVFAGVYGGTILGMSGSGLLIDATGDWAWAFYFWGAMGILWYIFFLFMCFSDPTTHPFITPKELDMLEEKITTKKHFNTPWKKFCGSMVFLALNFGESGHDWIHYTVLTELPKYMKSILKFSIKDNGLASSLPYLALWVCALFSGWVCDYIIIHEKLSIVNVRRIATAIAAIAPSAFCLVAVYIGCNRIAAVGMFTFAMMTMGPFYPGMKVNILDVTTNFAGTFMAIINGIGAIAGFAATVIVGYLVPNSSLSEWQHVFWLMLGVAILTTIVYCVWTSSTRATWDYPPPDS